MSGFGNIDLPLHAPRPCLLMPWRRFEVYWRVKPGELSALYVLPSSVIIGTDSLVRSAVGADARRVKVCEPTNHGRRRGQSHRPGVLPHY